MKNTLFFLFITFFNLKLNGQNKSILSEYSAEWNKPYYSDTLESFDTYFLNEDETRLSQVINLARKNPRLFAESVLLPYAKKNGYTAPLQLLIQKMSNPSPLSKITPEHSLTNLLRKRVLAKLDSTDHNFIIKDSVFTDPIYFQVNDDDIINLFCGLLSDESAAGNSFRDQLLGTNSGLAICIRNKPSNTKIIILQMFSAERVKQFEYKYISEWNIHYQTGERMPFCTYQESKTDSLFKYFISKLDFSLSNSIPVTKERLIYLKDSLDKENIFYKVHSRDETYETYETKIRNKNGQVIKKKEYFQRSYAHSNFQYGIMEIPKGFSYYFLGKTTESHKEENIVFEKIYIEDAAPRFHPNDIGKLPSGFNIYNFQSKSLQVPITNVSQMAKEITKPYKSELEKVAAIFLWINHNIPYDWAGLENHNAAYTTESTLKKKSGVCGGQANLFMDLCNSVGIYSNYIIGCTASGEVMSHAWNSVCIDSQWYLIDVTWGMNFFCIDPWTFFKSGHFPNQNKWTLLPEFCSIEQFKIDVNSPY